MNANEREWGKEEAAPAVRNGRGTRGTEEPMDATVVPLWTSSIGLIRPTPASYLRSFAAIQVLAVVPSGRARVIIASETASFRGDGPSGRVPARARRLPSPGSCVGDRLEPHQLALAGGSA